MTGSDLECLADVGRNLATDAQGRSDLRFQKHGSGQTDHAQHVR